MDKICPECLDEYGPEKEKCSGCDSELIPLNEFKINTIWPHCKKCQSAVSESDVKCKQCGQPFYIIPFFPKSSAFIMGMTGIACTGFLLDKAGASMYAMEGIAFVVGAVTWGFFIKRYHVIKKEGNIAWSEIAQNSRSNYRKQKRAAMS